jgi:hypothetical protein
MVSNTDYRTCSFVVINNILDAEELNRKQSNITPRKQHLPINNKVKTHSSNQVQNIVKANFFVIKFESTKSGINEETYRLTKENTLCY